MTMLAFLRSKYCEAREIIDEIRRTHPGDVPAPRPDGYEPIPDAPDLSSPEHTSHGVAEIEALASVWSTKTLYTGYVLVFIIFFINSLQQQTTGSLSPYVYSEFTDHSLIAMTNVLTSIIGGVSKLPIAKLIDILGRPEGFAAMVALCTLGLVLMAACRNVETYVAAQIIYWVGYNGMDYVLHVFMSDTTELVNRAFVYGIASFPYVITTFIGPAAAQVLYEHNALYTGFGIFALLTPVVTAPLLCLLWRTRTKARSAGIIQPKPRSHSRLRTIIHYAVEFDPIGMLLITAGFVLILLPLTLATSGTNLWSPSLLARWMAPDLIAMIVLGVLCVVGFVCWERSGAPVCFVPYSRLRDPTLLGAFLLACAMFMSFYCWDLYFSSYLQVVFNTSIRDTGYIYNIYSIGSCMISIPVGILIRHLGRFKTPALVAIPLFILGTFLMIPFRSPTSHISAVIACEILKALAGGTLVICQEIAGLATGSHETIAVSFALVGLGAKIGCAVGAAVSGMIWTSTVPVYIERYLPDSKKRLAGELYGSMAKVLEFAPGTEEREAVVAAYGVAQKRMLVVGLAVLPVAVGGIAMWRDIRLKGDHRGS
ncbi:putative transporter [Aspergillus saccharolyticus JOP 1030-1]|uniref:Putative transporter n=1 Tax=Aspergillus saccharolyticus JOP 1030-1 TaxID=1450539 RepID=A0A318YZ95_9EURO|nr:putative transporter [Aspergillus saccharolyticus JOP 1030-1]PYH40331.1 putative transporter [Aspergillus saccharolyticus JOP 1030-1]